MSYLAVEECLKWHIFFIACLTFLLFSNLSNAFITVSTLWPVSHFLNMAYCVVMYCSNFRWWVMRFRLSRHSCWVGEDLKTERLVSMTENETLPSLSL